MLPFYGHWQKIFFTQSRNWFNPKARLVLLIDNYDSFTYNLVDYLAQLGVTCDVQRNDVDFNKIICNSYEGIIFSPGPEEPSSAGIMTKLLAHCAGNLPILGICLGHQAIGQYFGAKLVKADKPMHGKISKIICEEHELYDTVPSEHEVVRYNSLLIENIQNPLQVISKTSAGEVMAIAHKKLPIWGVQYHPEAALSEHGLTTLKNWVDTLKVVANH